MHSSPHPMAKPSFVIPKLDQHMPHINSQSTVLRPSKKRVHTRFYFSMNNPLENLRILNTRPEHLAAHTRQYIIASGGIAIAFPLIEIKKAANHWINILPSLQNIQKAI